MATGLAGRSRTLCFSVLVLFVAAINHTVAIRLNEWIGHYEQLDYDHEAVQHRAKRSLDGYHTVIPITFNSHNRTFRLRLRRDTSDVFAPDFKVESYDGRLVDVDLSRIVDGELEDEPRSRVFGAIHDGVFEGKIQTRDGDAFFVERVHHYFPSQSKSRTKRTTATKPHFHSVIYSAKEVATHHLGTFGHHHHHDSHPHQVADGVKLGEGCGANHDTQQWMNEIANSAVESVDDQLGTSDVDDRANLHRHKRGSTNYWTPVKTFEAQERIGRLYPTPPPSTYNLSPSSSGSIFVPQKRACSLYIQTDTYLWDHVKKNEPSDPRAREEIASLVAQHIKAVNHIYENSVFNNIHGLKFIVQRLKINDSVACDSQYKRDHNPFCSPNIDVSNFLNLNSQFNHNDFCLAYIFTYRDFSGGTLGLAWVASTSGASGGICEKYKSYTENIGGRQVQTKRSLNTGIITFVNYNSRVPPKVSELTLAHEIGHNFGSPHDFPLECRPGGVLGNYIMYSSATSGERANNNKFSSCSVRNISAVLHAVFNNEGKDNCFQEDDGPFCGNKIVEEGEQCDCGYDQKECNEVCCYPREIEQFLPSDPQARACHRRPSSHCSPSEGPCCTESCVFESNKKQCRHESECNYESFCNGYKATCPRPPPKPNKTECNGGTQVCWQGSCVGSICQKYDLEECFLTAKGGAKPDEMCEVACQIPGLPNTCHRTSEIQSMQNISGLKLRPGSPCNDFQGYCDVFQRCRAVDAEGPLARLKNLLLNQRTLMSIKQWVTTYWWACILMGIALMLFMAAFIKCCAVHTPSSNPKKRPALKITDTLRRPADTLRRKRNPNNGRSHSSRSHQQNQQQQQPLAPSSAQGHQSAQQSRHYAPQLVVALPPEGAPSAPIMELPSAPVMDPPPPYSATNTMPPALPPRPLLLVPLAGPSHGYGEGRGHYNRKGQTNVPTSVKPLGGKPGDKDQPGKSNKKDNSFEMKSRR